MYWNYYVKHKHRLSSEAVKLSEIMHGMYEGDSGIEKEELKEKVKEHEDIKINDLERLMSLLILSKNIEIRDGKAHVLGDHCGCKGVKKDPFREFPTWV